MKNVFPHIFFSMKNAAEEGEDEMKKTDNRN